MALTMSLEGKVAIVTGGSKGIGRELAIGLSAAGATVVVGYKTDEEGARATCVAIAESGGTAVPVQADVSIEQSVSRLIGTTHDTCGSVDVLVNNAGRTRHTPVGDVTRQDWDDVMDTNLRGPFLASVAAAEAMTSGGVIINVSSCTATLAGAYPQVVYTTSKGGVEVMTRQLAIELAPKVRVNALAPGATAIERTLEYGPMFRESWGQIVPLGRVAEPRDYIPPLVFLASDASAYMTGQTLHVDGGWSIQGNYPDRSLFNFTGDRQRG